MKNLKLKVIGYSLALLGGAGAFYGLNKIKSEIYAYYKLVHDNDSLKTECSSLNVEKDYWIKQAVKCQTERTQKFLEESKAFREELKQRKTNYNKITEKERDEEFEEIKKGVMEEFNK